MLNEKNINNQEEIIRQERIKNGTLIDIQKEIREGDGEKYIPALLEAIENEDEEEKQKILKQIGCDLHTIMKQEQMPSIEDIGSGEYKICCLTGTAGQRGLLRISEDISKLNFPDLDDRQCNKNASFKEAVEQLFNAESDNNNSCVVEIK